MNQRHFFEVSTLVLFFLVNISETQPVRGIPGADAEVWQDAALKKLSGPWSDVRKVNGEDEDYNYYGAPFQDFEPSIEDLPADSPEVSYSGEVADFPSNYEEAVPVDDQSSSDENHGDIITESLESEEDVHWPTSEK